MRAVQPSRLRYECDFVSVLRRSPQPPRAALADGAVLEPKKLRWPQALAVQPLQARGSSYWSFTQIWQATPCAPA
jgi:hypothetical protein